MPHFPVIRFPFRVRRTPSPTSSLKFGSISSVPGSLYPFWCAQVGTIRASSLYLLMPGDEILDLPRFSLAHILAQVETNFSFSRAVK